MGEDGGSEIARPRSDRTKGKVMTETSGGSHVDQGVIEQRGFIGILLDWGYRALLGLCALPALMSTIIVITYFAHSASALLIFVLCAPIPLACAVLILPWRILLKNRVMKTVTLIATCIAAHRLYASSGTFKALAHSQTLFVVCCVILVAGVVSLVLYTRHTRRKMWPVVVGTALVLVSFIFGTGNPQWSRYIFIWQVHYSPWKQDAANLPTNRAGTRRVLPKYTEWDARGHKTAEWTHPNGELLRTVFYPNGQKRMERLYAEGQFVTSWYPGGQMEYHHDRQTRRHRAWDPNGTPREGEVRENPPGSGSVETVRQYKDGYFDGAHRYWRRPGGPLMRERHYRDGQQHGVTKEWNAQGVLTSEEHYVDGHRHGSRRRFGEDGSLQWEETYARGVLQGGRKRHPAPK